MASRRLPSGIIDDIFEPLGKATVNQVRNAVRRYVKYQKNSVANAAKIRSSNAKEIKSVEKRVLKNTSPKTVTRKPTNSVKPPQEKFMRAPVVRDPKTTKGNAKTVRAKELAMNHFPNKSTFEKAVREERKAMGFGGKK